MASFVTHSYKDEERIEALEHQLRGLIKWKELFVSSLGLAVAANVDLFGHGVPPYLPRYVQAEKHPGPIHEPDERHAVPEEQATKEGNAIAQTNLGTDGILSPTGGITSDTLPSEKAAAQAEIAGKVLDIIQAYGKHLGNRPGDLEGGQWAGRAKFTPKVLHWIARGEPVRMILPAFPWKSVNRVEKVIGALPDLGEELALARLQALCDEIGQVYELGAEVHIATDGLVFNDLLGISDDDTWEYSVALMKMVADRGFSGIKLTRVMDVLGLTKGEEMTKELYMDTTVEARRQLDSQFGDANRDVRKLMKEDEDTMLTYCGFIRFLRTDLKHSPVAAHVKGSNEYRRVTKEVAMGMMTRAESFTKIILAKRGDYVRLSVHPSSGAVKLSMPLVPQRGQDGWPRTPWHCAIAVGVDGSYRTVHAVDVRGTHNLIYRNGQPYFFREKSPLYDWEDDIVEFEHLYPQGLVVRPKTGLTTSPVLNESHLAKLRQLAALQGPITAEGFKEDVGMMLKAGAGV